jgi:rare lipoprotein A
MYRRPYGHYSLYLLPLSSICLISCGHATHRLSRENIHFPLHYTEKGLASWYGRKFHGRKTASGEVYNMNKYTAAHRYLPLGSRIQVTNLTNHDSVIVRINDRGPFVKDRILDLSYGAARAINMVDDGLAPVRLEVIQLPADQRPPNLFIQVGAFKDRENANRIYLRLSQYYQTHLTACRGAYPHILYKIRVGPFTRVDLTRSKLDELKAMGFVDSFIIDE